jgi:hypothetical protein
MITFLTVSYRHLAELFARLTAGLRCTGYNGVTYITGLQNQ